jgi:high-affinity nickel-transport protein
MHDLPTEWTALAALVFLLGVKHGFDADHLATIDGLTRLNARHRNPWARYCGALFSLGHGAVVMLIALTVGYATARWQAPQWLEVSGTVISLGFLVALGVLNLRAVLATPAHELVAPVGVKGRFLGALTRAQHPALIALVGALFALSFDTVSQAALFAVTGAQFGGVEHALALGVIFTLGMLVTDGINGLWISRLIARADQIALIASRVMSLAVAGVSLLVAGFGLARMTMPMVDSWSEGKDLLFGGVVVTLVLASFVVARLLAGRPQAA